MIMESKEAVNQIYFPSSYFVTDIKKTGVAFTKSFTFTQSKFGDT